MLESVDGKLRPTAGRTPQHTWLTPSGKKGGDGRTGHMRLVMGEQGT